METENPELTLVEEIADMTDDPAGFARFAYADDPREWQSEVLEELGEHLRNPDTRYTPFCMAVSSGHGIGKSTLLGMIIQWGMSTCEDCRVVVTANTGTQLETKTVPTVEEWFRKGINAHWFDMKAKSITVKEEGHGRTWRTDYITWSKENTEAFAGLHNKGRRIILIFDEASAIDDKIWEVSEGALTDEDTEIIWLAFGNPTKNTGRFRECFGKLKHRWRTKQIDSRNVEGTNKAEIEKWANDYGDDSDFFRVRVKGEFPRAGSTQFISTDIVSACREYTAQGYEGMPKILSVDVARFGDNQTVIGKRQGRKFVVLKKYRGLSTAQTGDYVIEYIEAEQPDAIVIDGDGLGAGVVDHITYRGFNKRLFEFHGGTAASDANKYFNKRAECWGIMRDWLQAVADIPDDPELEQDLTGPEYGFSNKGQIQLEKKEDMAARGLASPDIGDCLAQTFGVKVAAPKQKRKPEMITVGQRDQGWMA